MKISKETWKDILKIVGTIIATIASVPVSYTHLESSNRASGQPLRQLKNVKT